MNEVIEKQAEAKAQPDKKKWSWILFFLIGGIFNQKLLNAGLVAICAYVVLLFLLPSVFYRITRKVAWPKSKYIKHVLVGLVLLMLVAFVLGAASAIDAMLV